MGNATKLYDLGYTDLVSVEAGGKRPALREAHGGPWKGYSWNGKVDRAFAEKMDEDGANIGLRSRRYPGLDIDSDSPDLTLLVEKLATAILGPGAVRLSSSERRMLVYRRTGHPFKKRKLTVRMVDGSTHAVEMLADGQQYVIHGKHPSGSQYRFLRGNLLPKDPKLLHPVNAQKVDRFFGLLLDGLEANGHEASLSGSVGPTERAAPLEEAIAEGERSDRLVSLAGSLRHRNVPESAILLAVMETNEQRCEPPLSEEEVQAIVRSVMRYEAKVDIGTVKQKASDVFEVQDSLASLAPPVPPQGDFEEYTGSEFMALVLPKEKWLIEGLIPRMDSSLIVAKPKIGKSILARDLALSVALGRPFLGKETIHGNVVYIVFPGEGSKHEWQEELGFLQLAGHPNEDNFKLLIDPAWDMTKASIVEAIARRALKHKPVLIIADTLQGLVRSEDINNYSKTYEALAPIRGVQAETGAHLMLLHHEPKGSKDEYADPIEAALGSTAIGGSVDVALRIHRDNEDGTRFISARGRRSVDFPPHVLSMEPTTHRLELGAESHVLRESKLQARILAVFEDDTPYLTGPDFASEVGGNKQARQQAIKHLIDQGALRKEGAASATKYYLVNAHDVFKPEEVSSADGS